MFVVDQPRRRVLETPATRGQGLASLDSCDLRDRFYSWRDASGRRLICSIFHLQEESVVADFSRALVIGVIRDGATRRPICILSSGEFETDDGRLIRAEARAMGVNEWHVRFDAGDEPRRALAAALLN